MKRLPTTCPACGSALEVAELHCASCGTTVRGSFPLDRFAALPPEEEAFLLVFLAARGNLKEVQERLDISYPTVRSRLDRLLLALGLTEEERTPRRPTVSELLDKLEAGEMTADEVLKTVKGGSGEPDTGTGA